MEKENYGFLELLMRENNTNDIEREGRVFMLCLVCFTSFLLPFFYRQIRSQSQEVRPKQAPKAAEEEMKFSTIIVKYFHCETHLFDLKQHFSQSTHPRRTECRTQCRNYLQRQEEIEKILQDSPSKQIHRLIPDNFYI